MSDLLGRAVRNNADWCGRVCSLHGAPGRLGYAAWICGHPAPRYYPNVVTLRPDCGTAQMEAISHLTRLPEGWGVKDSFQTLDLAPLGFRAAIEGRWVRYTPASAIGLDLEWRRITTPLALAQWENAWGGDGHMGHSRIFLPQILADATIEIFGVFADGRLEAGGIVNRAAEVAGLSNIFASRPELAGEVICYAQTLAGSLPMVGWEVEDALRNVEVLGPLRVWLHDVPSDRASDRALR